MATTPATRCPSPARAARCVPRHAAAPRRGAASACAAAPRPRSCATGTSRASSPSPLQRGGLLSLRLDCGGALTDGGLRKALRDQHALRTLHLSACWSLSLRAVAAALAAARLARPLADLRVELFARPDDMALRDEIEISNEGKSSSDDEGSGRIVSVLDALRPHVCDTALHVRRSPLLAALSAAGANDFDEFGAPVPPSTLDDDDDELDFGIHGSPARGDSVLAALACRFGDVGSIRLTRADLRELRAAVAQWLLLGIHGG